MGPRRISGIAMDSPLCGFKRDKWNVHPYYLGISLFQKVSKVDKKLSMYIYNSRKDVEVRLRSSSENEMHVNDCKTIEITLSDPM